MFGSNERQYDEERQERLERDSPSSCQRWSMKYLRFPRLNRSAALMLLLVDLSIVCLLVYTLEPLITLLRRNDELFNPRITIPRNATWGSSHFDNEVSHPRIPRILHQTTPNTTIPEKWAQSQRSCRETYADFEYMVSLSDNLALLMNPMIHCAFLDLHSPLCQHD
jgi:hypothetical protein